MKENNGGSGMSDDAVKSFVLFVLAVALNSVLLRIALLIATYLDMYFLATLPWQIESGLGRGLLYALTITERSLVQLTFEFIFTLGLIKNCEMGIHNSF